MTTCLTAGAARAQALGDPSTYRTDEFWLSWGVAMIGAEYAYALGVDGSGVKVGVVDSGIVATSPELAGQVVGGHDYVVGGPGLIDPADHGTGVASIIAARRDGVGIHGVAPGAQVINARILTDEGMVRVNDPIIGQAWSDLLDQGVRIINNSWGSFDARATDSTAADIELREPGSVAAARSAVDRGALMIVITHNAGMDQANEDSAYPYYFPELERGWLAVTAVGATRQIASYANHCGVAMNWCLAAPGGDGEVDGYGLAVLAADGEIVGEHGTSYAAPHAAGTAALVWQMFPHFTTDQVRQTLLGTAIDLGAPGVDAVYGYGLLSAARAVRGPGRFDWGDFVVDQPGGYSNWYNGISGEGGLVKQGAGALVLYGDSDYAGQTRVLDGLLAVQGAIASDTLVGEGGRLAGTGRVGGAARNEGVIAPGNAWLLGVLTIDGDVEVAHSGRVVVGLAPGGLTNRLDVNGAVRLEGGAVAPIFAPGLYRSSYTQAMIVADGGVTGRFAGVETPSTAFLSTSLSYEADAVNLTLHRRAFNDQAVCEDRNQCAVGSAFERGLGTTDQDFLGAATALQHASTEVARNGMASLSGQAYASMASLALDAEQALASRLADGVVPGAWMRASGAWGQLEGGQGASGADHRRGGLSGGRDWRLTDTLIGGVSLGYNDLTVDFDRFDARGETKIYEAAGYGRYAEGRLAVEGWASYAQLSNSLSREVSIGAEGRMARAKYDGARIVAFAEVSYGFELAGVTLSPLASLRYGRLDQDGFVERGAGGVGLMGEELSLESVQSGLGAQASAAFHSAWSSAKLEGRAIWLHEHGDDRPVLEAAFVGAPRASFASYGVERDRDSLLLGVGLSAVVGPSATLFVDLQAKLGDRATTQAAAAGVRFAW